VALHDTIRTAHGCRESCIYQDISGDENLLLSSQWENGTAFEKYMQSKHGGIFLGAIDLLGEKVEISICENVHVAGIKTLKQMRTGL
jgi:quinol monooxygenase YgiN